LFAGRRRRADIRDHLQELELHGMADDLLDNKIWDNQLASLANGDWDVLLGTPPCNTHTRVVWSNSRGPKPHAHSGWEVRGIGCAGAPWPGLARALWPELAPAPWG
jgi:hypothetical protein